MATKKNFNTDGLTTSANSNLVLGGDIVSSGNLGIYIPTTVSGTNESGIPGVSGSQTFNAALSVNPGLNTVQSGWTVTGNNLVGTTTVTSVIETSPGLYEITTNTGELNPFWYNDVYVFFGPPSGSYVFSTTGNLTTPSNLVIGGNVAGGSSIYQFDAPLQVLGEGANSALIVGWTANSSGPEDVTAIAFNNPLGNGAGNLVIGVGNNSTTVNYWNFDNTGALTLPGSGYIVNPVNSSLDPLNPNVSTMILSPDQGYSSQSLVLDPTAPGHIHLRAPGANIDEPYANIFLGGEDSSFEVGYYTGSAPNVFIHSGGNTWTFDNAGNLTTPGSVKVTTQTGNLVLGRATATGSPGLSSTSSVTFAANRDGTVKEMVFDTTGNLSLPGNISATNIGNIVSANLDGSASNVLYGNGVFAPAAGGSSNSISSGNSSVSIPAANGNVIVSASGSNVVTVTEFSEMFFDFTFLLGDYTGTNAQVTLQVAAGDPRMILANYAHGNASSAYYPDRILFGTDDYFGSIGQNQGYYISNTTTNSEINLNLFTGNGRIYINDGDTASFYANGGYLESYNAAGNGFYSNTTRAYHTGNFSATNVQANTVFQLPVYASNTARDTAISSPATGMMVFVTGSGMQVYGATAWNVVAGTST